MKFAEWDLFIVVTTTSDCMMVIITGAHRTGLPSVVPLGSTIITICFI